MKKFLLTLILVIGFTLPTFSEEKGMATLDFANQTGELMGQATVCGIDTANVDQQMIKSITILANYRKETSEDAVQAYKSSVQRQLSSPASSYDCDQVHSDFDQVEVQLEKSLK